MNWWYFPARENSRHFARPPLVSPQNDCRNSILMTCCYPFWLVASPEKFFSTNQKHYPDLGSDRSTVWNLWSRLLRFLRSHFAGTPVGHPSTRKGRFRAPKTQVFKKGPQSGDCWKRQLLFYEWTDENGCFRSYSVWNASVFPTF